MLFPAPFWAPFAIIPFGFTLAASLPLMGIGNKAEGLSAHNVPHLITPHGDWKQVVEQVEPELAQDSLPLMGIGNRILACL